MHREVEHQISIAMRTHRMPAQPLDVEFDFQHMISPLCTRAFSFKFLLFYQFQLQWDLFTINALGFWLIRWLYRLSIVTVLLAVSTVSKLWLVSQNLNTYTPSRPQAGDVHRICLLPFRVVLSLRPRAQNPYYRDQNT
jgi:hypothetical protein